MHVTNAQERGTCSCVHSHSQGLTPRFMQGGHEGKQLTGHQKMTAFEAMFLSIPIPVIHHTRLLQVGGVVAVRVLVWVRKEVEATWRVVPDWWHRLPRNSTR